MKKFINLFVFAALMVSPLVAAAQADDCTDYATVPYATGFEGYSTGSVPTCWQQILSDTRPGFATFPSCYEYSGNARNGSVYFELESTSGAVELIALPLMQDIYTLKLTFWASAQSSYLPTVFEVGVMEDTVFVPIDTINLITSSNWHTGYNEYTVYFSDYTGTGERMAMRAYKTSGQYTIMIDDLSVSVDNGCNRPGNPTVSNVGPYSATLSWSAGGFAATDYEVVYTTTGDMNDPNAVTVSSMGDTTVTLTGLLPQTTYYAWVHSVCGGDYGDYASFGSFTTQLTCAPVTNLTVSNVGFTAIAVEWAYDTTQGFPTSGAYVVLTDPTDEDFTPIESIVTGTSASFTGLEAGHPYHIQVRNMCDTEEQTDTASVVSINVTTKSCSSIEGMGSESGTNQYVPTYNYYSYSYAQMIYPASAMPNIDTIRGVSFYLTSTNSSSRTVDVYMGNVATSTFENSSAWMPVDSMSLVATGASLALNNTGWVTIIFDSAFVYDGSSNLIVAVDDNTGNWVSSVYWRTHSATNQAISVYSDGTNYDPTNTSSYTGTYRQALPDISFMANCDVPSCEAAILSVYGHDSASVTLSWVVTDGSSNFVVEQTTGSAPFTTVGSTSDTSYVVTGLNANTLYQFRVGVVCDSDTLWSYASARTDCGIMALPAFFDWEDVEYNGAWPSCWTRILNHNTDPSVNYNYNHTPGGQYSMYLQAYNDYNMFASSVVPLPGNQILVSFFARLNTSYYGSDAWLQAGVMTSLTDTSTFVPMLTITDVDDTWREYEFNTSSLSSDSVYYVAFKGTSSYPYGSFGAIDDITIRFDDGCHRLAGVNIVAVDTVSVTLGWNAEDMGTTYAVEYSADGGTTWSSTATTTDTTYTFSGLSVATSYTFRVAMLCSGDDTIWTSISATTMNVPIVTFPYSTGFEAGDDNNWLFANGTNAWVIDTAVAMSGSRALYISNDGGASNSYTNSSTTVSYAYRAMTISDTGRYAFSFDWRANGESNYDYIRVFLVPITVEFTANAMPDGYTSTYSFKNYTPAGWTDITAGGINQNASWTNGLYTFDVNTAGDYNLLFMWINDGSAGSQPPAAIDNVQLARLSCIAPSDIVTTQAESSTVTFSWTPGDAESQWEVEINGTTAIVSTPSYTATGLEANTSYTVRVRSVCGMGDTSFWISGLVTSGICDNATEALSYDTTMSQGTSSYSPLGSSTWNYGYVQTIVDSANLADLAGDITAFAFNPVDGNKGDYYTNMTVFMANVSESDLSSGWILPDATHSFVKVIDSADFTYTEGGWQIHNLDTAFAWDGHSNLLIAVKRDHGTWSSGASFVAHSDTVARMRYAYRDGSAYDYTNPDVTGSTSTNIGDIRLISCGAGCMAPVISSTSATDNSITVNFVADSAVEVVITDGIWDSEATGTEIMGNTHTFTGLDYNTTYTIGLRSICAEGAVSNWALVTVTTEDVPCMAPTALAISDITFRSATATWTAGGEEANWEVNIFNTNINESYTTTAPTYAFSNLTTGTQYSVSVRALCGSDASIEGPWSDTVVFTTDACQPVTGVTVSNLTATTAQVSWTASSNSSIYRVEYGFRGMSQGEGTSVTVNATSYTITGLQPETEYDVYVQAVCEGGENSVWSDVSSFTTPAASGNIYTISAVPADPTMGSVQGGGSYEENMQITLTAVPNEGYHFVRWQDGNTDNPRVVTVTGNATYVATFEANAGIEDINGAGYVSLYPNPASSTVTVSVEGNESEVVVTIVDMNGREVKRERTSGSVLTMDISSLSQGAYFVRLTGERVNAIRKLIVK